MRVGAFARSLMLRGECTVDLVLMCTGRPTQSPRPLVSHVLLSTGRPTAALFHDIARRMPAKFEVSIIYQFHLILIFFNSFPGLLSYLSVFPSPLDWLPGRSCPVRWCTT